jgi:hypothetical protein
MMLSRQALHKLRPSLVRVAARSLANNAQAKASSSWSSSSSSKDNDLFWKAGLLGLLSTATAAGASSVAMMEKASPPPPPPTHKSELKPFDRAPPPKQDVNNPPPPSRSSNHPVGGSGRSLRGRSLVVHFSWCRLRFNLFHSWSSWRYSSSSHGGWTRSGTLLGSLPSTFTRPCRRLDGKIPHR